jgi:hypothetical protein
MNIYNRWRTRKLSRLRSSDSGKDAQIVLTATQARQGFLGKPVLVVLAVSMALAIIMVIVVLAL